MVSDLYIFEGADGVGKSTIAKLLGELLGAPVIHQPNPEGVLGFIRTEVKTNPDYDSFSRQLLHTVSHVWDHAELKHANYPLVIMDRSWISGQVYGKLFGLSDSQLKLLWKINYSTLKEAVQNVTVVFLHAPKPHKSKKDKDIYEENTRFTELQELYQDVLNNLPSDYRVIHIDASRPLPSVVLDIAFKVPFKNLPIDRLLEEVFDAEISSEILWISKIVPGRTITELSYGERENLTDLVSCYADK